ncbi:MAG: mechanosensitive ion channel family protein [Candidatus Saganbacteria bacterium]|nr:mechanosensitive ion channel family protein [Candidatus Saganbacteria bacterium]
MARFDSFFHLLANRSVLAAGTAYLLWLGLGWLVIANFDRIARRLVRKTATKLDDLLLEEARFPLWLLMVVIGLFAVARYFELPRFIGVRIDRGAALTVAFAALYLAIRLLINLARVAAENNAGLRNVYPSLANLARLAAWGTGLVMLLDLFGVSVTPVLASLGIAGLAVGLALQDTLGNFFAGVYLLVSQSVRLGDFIELDNGLKGFVEKISWRETRVRTLPNNIVIVPNSKLAQTVITNYHLPESEQACLVEVGVGYGSDLARVERVTVEVAKVVLEKTAGGVPGFTPFIRYHTFGDFSVGFTVILRVREYTDRYLVSHEFIKALHERYREEKIEIPFPVRTVKLQGEQD